jgi:nitroreductase
MNVMEAIALRHSVREYRPGPVPAELLRAVIAAAQKAPSSRNVQPCEFIVVTDPAQRRALRGAANDQAQVEQAGATLVCLASLRQQDALADRIEEMLTPDLPVEERERILRVLQRHRHDEEFRRAHVAHSTYIAIGFATLAATELGLGTCIMGSFQQDAVKALLGIPDDFLVVALVSVGWPAPPPQPAGHSRRPVEEIIHWNQF